MSDDQNVFSDPSNLLSAWIQTASDFWGEMLQAWSGPAKDREAAATSEYQDKSRPQETLAAVLKTWQTLSAVAQDPGASEALSNVTHTMPDILRKMVQAGWQGLFHVQQQWLEKAGRIERSTQAYSFEHLDKNTFKTWAEIYENEFRQFLHIPQLGLTRVYQEKFNQAMDNYNRFQTAFAGFMYLFYLPMEKSLKVLQDEVGKMAEEGKLTEDYNAYYRQWIKILEGHYMNLFKSAEYVQTMGETLDTLEEFLKARDSVIQDLLKALAVPTQKDMDDLYQEMYQLKKRIRKLEKER
jgi:class III poly(R)-hydroxyalkanoic acid synthase PhaE subunit